MQQCEGCGVWGQEGAIRCRNCGRPIAQDFSDLDPSIAEAQEIAKVDEEAARSTERGQGAEEQGLGWFLFSFSGRVGRSEYWAYSIATTILVFGMHYFLAKWALSVTTNKEHIDATLRGAEIMGTAISFFVLLWPSLAVSAKRWHDVGRSSGWSILLFIPFVNVLVVLYLAFAPGTPSLNEYGAPLN